MFMRSSGPGRYGAEVRRRKADAPPPRARSTHLPAHNHTWHSLATAPRAPRGGSWRQGNSTQLVWQGTGGAAPDQVQRSPDDQKSALTNVAMTFDGSNLIVTDEGTEIARFPATSGRPTRVKDTHAKLCGGSNTDTYVNNPRYVAVKDHGAIPEGKYSINPKAIESFSTAEQTELLDAAARGEKNITLRGTRIHAGDWGRGRVLIAPRQVEPGPKPCTKTHLRSGFFLHGGVLRGSAGCIDIGSNFDDLDRLLRGYRKSIPLTVTYPDTPATTMSPCELTLGKLFYEGELGNPLTFITCFNEVKNAADPEAKAIWEELEKRFLERKGGSLLNVLGGG